VNDHNEHLVPLLTLDTTVNKAHGATFVKVPQELGEADWGG